MEETGSQPEGNLKKAYPALVKNGNRRPLQFEISGRKVDFKFVLLYVGSLSALGSCSSPDQLGAD